MAGAAMVGATVAVRVIIACAAIVGATVGVDTPHELNSVKNINTKNVIADKVPSTSNQFDLVEGLAVDRIDVEEGEGETGGV